MEEDALRMVRTRQKWVLIILAATFKRMREITVTRRLNEAAIAIKAGSLYLYVARYIVPVLFASSIYN